MCRSVLQCVAVCYSAGLGEEVEAGAYVRRGKAKASVHHTLSLCASTPPPLLAPLQHAVAPSNTLQHTVAYCNTLQHVAARTLSAAPPPPFEHCILGVGREGGSLGHGFDCGSWCQCGVTHTCTHTRTVASNLDTATHHAATCCSTPHCNTLSCTTVQHTTRRHPRLSRRGNI